MNTKKITILDQSDLLSVTGGGCQIRLKKKGGDNPLNPSTCNACCSGDDPVLKDFLAL